MSSRKRKKRKKKKKKHGSIHHLLPQSKGGPKKYWNERNKPIERHRGFHTLFANMFPCDAMNTIKQKWAKRSGRLKKSELSKKQMQAWEALFNSNSIEEAAKIIRRHWTVKDQPTFRGCFGYKECFSDSLKKVCPLVKLYKRGLLPVGRGPIKEQKK